jgi:hypothetical protein
MQTDIEVGELKLVVHLHRHQEGRPYAGYPALMASVVKDPELTEFADYPPVDPDDLAEAAGIAGRPELAQLAGLIRDDSYMNENVIYRSVCNALGLDPDYWPPDRNKSS